MSDLSGREENIHQRKPSRQKLTPEIELLPKTPSTKSAQPQSERTGLQRSLRDKLLAFLLMLYQGIISLTVVLTFIVAIQALLHSNPAVKPKTPVGTVTTDDSSGEPPRHTDEFPSGKANDSITLSKKLKEQLTKLGEKVAAINKSLDAEVDDLSKLNSDLPGETERRDGLEPPIP